MTILNDLRKEFEIGLDDYMVEWETALREQMGLPVRESDDAVSRKIAKLRREGKSQDQAVAIALDMERRGELAEAGGKEETS